jgi:hypothetical protein
MTFIYGAFASRLFSRLDADRDRGRKLARLRDQGLFRASMIALSPIILLKLRLSQRPSCSRYGSGAAGAVRAGRHIGEVEAPGRVNRAGSFSPRNERATLPW